METPLRERQEPSALSGEKRPAPAPTDNMKAKKAKVTMPLPPGWAKKTQPMCKGNFGFRGPPHSGLRAQSKKAAWLVWNLFMDKLQLKVYRPESLEQKVTKELGYIAEAKRIDAADLDKEALIQKILEVQAHAQGVDPLAEEAEGEPAAAPEDQAEPEPEQPEPEAQEDDKETRTPAKAHAPSPKLSPKLSPTLSPTMSPKMSPQASPKVSPKAAARKPAVAAERMVSFMDRLLDVLQKAKKEHVAVDLVVQGVNEKAVEGGAFSREEVLACLRSLEANDRLSLIDDVVYML